jgi:uncharacterized protein YidB (DUF937 family)
MDITQIGAQLLNDNLGLDIDPQTIQSALSSLLGDGSGNIDLAALTGQFAAGGGLGDVVTSWLGDGTNSPISAETINNVLGSDKVADFAGQLGTDSGSAAGSLADMLPQLIDQASSGGSLLDSAGGLLGAAKSLF